MGSIAYGIFANSSYLSENTKTLRNIDITFDDEVQCELAIRHSVGYHI